jgi:hypothetical protein
MTDPFPAEIQVVTVEGLERRIADTQGRYDSAQADLVLSTQQATAATAAANASAAEADLAKTQLTASVTQALVDNAQTQAQVLASANRIPWTGGDHTTLPNGAGDYLIMRGLEAGQVWTRTGNGVAAYHNDALEGVTPGQVVGIGNGASLDGLRTYNPALLSKKPSVQVAGAQAENDGGAGVWKWRVGARPAENGIYTVYHSSDTSGYWARRWDGRNADLGWAGLAVTAGAAALTAALTVLAGLTVSVDKMYVSGAFSIPANTKLVADAPGLGFALAANSNSSFITLGAGAQLHSLTLDGQSSAQIGPAGFGMAIIKATAHATPAKLVGCAFKNAQNNCIYLYNSPGGIIIRDITVDGSRAEAFFAQVSSNIKIRAGTLKNLGSDGIKIHGSDPVYPTYVSTANEVTQLDINYSGVALTNNALGVELWGGVSCSTVSRINITGPASITGGGVFGVSFDHTDRCFGTDIHVDGQTGQNIYIGLELAGAIHSGFRSCSVKNFNGTGVSISRNDAFDNSLTDVSTDNNAKYFGGYGVQVVNGHPAIRISGGSHRDSGERGIFLNGSGAGSSMSGITFGTARQVGNMLAFYIFATSNVTVLGCSGLPLKVDVPQANWGAGTVQPGVISESTGVTWLGGSWNGSPPSDTTGTGKVSQDGLSFYGGSGACTIGFVNFANYGYNAVSGATATGPASTFIGLKLTNAGGVNVRATDIVLDASQIAKLSSPAFTGTPTAPTAAPGTNTTQVATTAFVTSALSGGAAAARGIAAGYSVHLADYEAATRTAAVLGLTPTAAQLGKSLDAVGHTGSATQGRQGATFTRASAAWQPGISQPNDTPRIFGSDAGSPTVLLEGAATNLNTRAAGAGGSSSSFPTGWGVLAASNATATVVGYGASADYPGSNYVDVRINGAAAGASLSLGLNGKDPVSAGVVTSGQITIQLLVGPFQGSVYWGNTWFNSGGSYIGENSVPNLVTNITGAPLRQSGSVTSPANTTAFTQRIYFNGLSAGSSQTYRISGPMVELAAGPSSFAVTTRAADTYRLDPLAAQFGGYAQPFGVAVGWVGNGGAGTLWETTNGARGLKLLRNTDGTVSLVATNSAGAATTITGAAVVAGRVPHTAFVEYDGTNLSLYLDGVLLGAATAFAMEGTYTALRLGGLVAGGGEVAALVAPGAPGVGVPLVNGNVSRTAAQISGLHTAWSNELSRVTLPF